MRLRVKLFPHLFPKTCLNAYDEQHKCVTEGVANNKSQPRTQHFGPMGTQSLCYVTRYATTLPSTGLWPNSSTRWSILTRCQTVLSLPNVAKLYILKSINPFLCHPSILGLAQWSNKSLYNCSSSLTAHVNVYWVTWSLKLSNGATVRCRGFVWRKWAKAA